MTAPLPSEGPEREIFLTALARMSEECQAPELIAECPFSVDLEGGGRGCGAECEDILAGLGPVQRPGEVRIPGLEMTARPRPRLPKPRAQVGRAFDAAEAFYLESEHSDLSIWTPVGLLVAACRAYTTHPFERSVKQVHQLDNCLSELRRRGFDVDSLLHGPLAQKVAQAIVMDVLVRSMQRALPESSDNCVDRRLALRDKLYEETETSRQGEPSLVLEGAQIDQDGAARLLFTLTGEFARLVTAVVQRSQCIGASASELLSWDVNLANDVNDDLSDPDYPEASWILERFTETYLSEWSPESLRMEWRHWRGQPQTALGPEQLASRRIDQVELATLVADLAAGREDKVVRNSSLIIAAVKMLESGLRDVAASVFEAVRRTDWNDSQLHNNYGFCLLPDHPQRALEALNIAFRSGYADVVNRANRALALFMLGRVAAAMEVAESALEVGEERHSSKSYLWSFDLGAGDPELLHECPRCYLVRLGGHIAKATGDQGLIETWTRRVDELSDASN